MNELKFLEAIGKIDSDLIKEADVEHKKTFPKRKIYAFGSAAAVAALAFGSVLLFNSYGQSGSVVDNSIIQLNKNEDNSQTSDNSIPQITESQTEHNPNTQSTKYYYQPFSAKIVPGSKSFGGDGFGEEELHHIDVRTSEGFYEQLALDEYASNGISSTIRKTDFGEYIGKIIEVDNSYEYHGNAAESQEPTLAGAEVYYYAPKGNNKAFIIVQQNDQCSIFFANEINTSEGFKNGFLFFNVQGAEDIMSVEYQKRIPDNEGKMILSEQNVITDSNAIKDFYNLVCQLKPEDYSGLPEFAATPLWYIEAWDKYKANPDAFVMEDYSIIITLKDGTVLREIRYQPFLANGYVENMQELTPEQNSTLKNLLK